MLLLAIAQGIEGTLVSSIHGEELFFLGMKKNSFFLRDEEELFKKEEIERIKSGKTPAS